jgi:hypothetical protein
MLRMDRTGKRLIRLEQSSLAGADHWERHLQEMICASPDAFSEELTEKLRVIGQEVRPWENVPDRIDILAVDDQGKSVIIELKRGTHKLQLLQAISYAGMIARWEGDKFVETLAQTSKQPLDEARSDIEEHITELSALNQSQRIILIAEDFDPAVLISAEWLHEKYNVDIRCYRVALSQEDAKDYLTCSCIYPPLEIASLRRGAHRMPDESGEGWPDWKAALEHVDNAALVDFCKVELNQSTVEERHRNRELFYRIDNKRRFFFHCRSKYAYVWQEGRFPGDDQYWRGHLSNPNTVIPVKDCRGLRFHLVTVDDFKAFGTAVRHDLTDKDFGEPEDFKEPAPLE